MGHISANSRAFFVTGTDTEVGKTFTAVALIRALNEKGLSTAAYKPISAGCTATPEGWQNEDALALQQVCSMPLTYQEINPLALPLAIAPHIAAQQYRQDGHVIDLSLAKIKEGFSHLLAKQADVLMIEGAGGWRLPLGNNANGEPSYLSDFVAQQNLAVIIVVGMRLGCLNHAMLTADSVRQHGLKVVGWVANQVDPDMPYLAENISSLAQLLAAPLLGILPRLDDPTQAVKYLDLSALGY
jgi:dethiobiotin synthetase